MLVFDHSYRFDNYHCSNAAEVQGEAGHIQLTMALCMSLGYARHAELG